MIYGNFLQLAISHRNEDMERKLAFYGVTGIAYASPLIVVYHTNAKELFLYIDPAIQ